MKIVGYLLCTLFATSLSLAQAPAPLEAVLNYPAGGARQMATSKDGHVFAATIGGLLRYTDSKGWERVTHDSMGSAFSVSTDGADGLILGTYEGRFYRSDRSDDIHWQYLLNGGGIVRNIDAASSGLIVAMSSDNLFVSTDHGHTWGKKVSGFTELSTTAQDKGVLYAVGREKYTGWLLRRSTDQGATWLSSNIGALPQVQDMCITQNGNFYLAAYGQGVYRSTDNGDTWTPLNQGITSNALPLRIVEDRTHRVYLATYGGGVFELDHVNSVWKEANAGLIDLPSDVRFASAIVYGLAVDSSDRIFASSWSKMAILEGDRKKWTTHTSGATYPNVWCISSWKSKDSTILFVGSYGRFAKTSTDGAIWDDLTASVNMDIINSVFVSNSGAVFVSGTPANRDHKSSFSKDIGQSWQALPFNLGSFTEGDSGIIGSSTVDGVYSVDENFQLKKVSVSAFRIISSGPTGTIIGSLKNKVFRSDNGGRAWVLAATLPLVDAVNAIEGLMIDSLDRIYVQAYGASGVYRIDTGVTSLCKGSSCATTLTGPFEGYIAICSPGKLIVERGNIRYQWTLPRYDYLCAHSVGNSLYIGTQGGLYKIDLMKLVELDVPKPKPGSISFLYPNPAKEFIMVPSGACSQPIRIFSSVGTLVAALPFVTTERVDIENLTSGFYFVEYMMSDGIHREHFLKY